MPTKLCFASKSYTPTKLRFVEKLVCRRNNIHHGIVTYTDELQFRRQELLPTWIRGCSWQYKKMCRYNLMRRFLNFDWHFFSSVKVKIVVVTCVYLFICFKTFWSLGLSSLPKPIWFIECVFDQSFYLFLILI